MSICLHVCMCTMCPLEVIRFWFFFFFFGIWHLERGGCEPPSGCWGCNPGPWKSGTEPPLQPTPSPTMRSIGDLSKDILGVGIHSSRESPFSFLSFLMRCITSQGLPCCTLCIFSKWGTFRGSSRTDALTQHWLSFVQVPQAIEILFICVVPGIESRTSHTAALSEILILKKK